MDVVAPVHRRSGNRGPIVDLVLGVNSGSGSRGG